ncbi:MAG TPA: M20/M25/M40 family metallo-hydrolase [bacterium]|nr:M20/M25/M40 family metallo-hydrolase [bacterium]HPR86582.1 M20/M25/M40 family metallo-hydrolase [bacterium]
MPIFRSTALVLFALQFGRAALLPAQEVQPEITAPEIQDHISYLASDALKGRRAGSPEAETAAAYIKEQFSRAGLTLLGDQGYQTFEVLNRLSAGENNHLTIDGVAASPGEFIPLDFSDNQALSAGVYFAGYGFSIQTDSLTWQDFAAAPAGQWALILRDGPPQPAGRDPYEAARSLRKKAQNAKDSGAAGILFVTGEAQDQEDALLPLRAEQGVVSMGLPVFQIRRSLAERLLQRSGTSLGALQHTLDTTLQPVPLPLTCTVDGQAEVIRHMGRTHNVVAELPGSDPLLRQEYVIIGAHYDHLGLGGPGSGSRRPDTLAIHNGADDNASGVAALLELAEKWAAASQKPKRSLLFIAFSGEEMGLLGSKYFVNNPLIDLTRVQLMINLDMVGRLNPDSRAVTCGGTGTAVGLGDLVQTLAAPYHLQMNLSPEGYGPSDHASFYGKDIPVLFLWTNISPEYHTPDDDAFRINASGEQAVTSLAFDLSRHAADQSERLVFQEAGPKEPPANMRRFKVTLGIMPDFASTGIKGLRADAVMPGRPAARAGMKKGDIIIAMEGKPVGDIYEYMNRLADFRVGQRISIEILRDSVKQILIVEL